MDLNESNLPVVINDKIISMTETDLTDGLSDKTKKFITIFYGKTEAYLARTNKIVLGNSITTKVIRMTADNLNQKEQIVLNKSALLSCELEDLLK